ncbi:MAG: cytochrome P450 [Anaerolineae bacterium]|jgi:cytochrome P450|nr:cytochrome P450 [Anaerolineae bacterium]
MSAAPIMNANIAAAAEAAGCPYHRRAAEPAAKSHRTVEQLPDGTWLVRGYREARQILRAELTKQSGFMSNLATQSGGVIQRLPVLFMDGPDHKAMRQESGKFFTPSAVDRNYREMIDQLSDDLINKLKAKGSADLSELTKTLAVQVASRIIGLTDSRLPGMPGRVSGILDNSNSLSKGGSFIGRTKMMANLMAFFHLDVKPSLKARRQQPREDLFSYLLTLGYTDIDLLTEAIVFGVAGMATTREFICVAAWHIMERPELRDIMLSDDEEARYNLLGEILRLEPVVGDLYRTAQTDITLNTPDGEVTIPAGARMQLSVVAANADASVVGDSPDAVCPARPMAEMKPKVPDYMLSFGDGDHRCPGAYVALRETDIFLRKLLAIPTLKLEKAPDRKFVDIIRGYELRRMVVSV